MQHIKNFLLLVCFLQFAIGVAQNKFPFIPSNQHQLTEAQIENTPINITADILLFNERGKILSMSNLSLMTNPDYKPLFFADTQGQVKSVVFIKQNKQPVLVEVNKEAAFTPGEKALDFIAKDINGKHYKLSELRGKVVVLNFWFTKCGPCIAEIPQLNALVSNFKNKDVVFLAITFNKKDIVKPFLESNPFAYTILPNANDVISMYRVNSYPTSIVINKKGEIVLKELGYRTNIKEVLATSIDASL
ncbi:peroxiredoxin [Oceanihabitans sediminis]|uniref:TlpA family protein disulfide reductase n=1 Tax=Oceanihabitans sediminis TaxID=1812012 RepID=A0A368P6D7_9FLAO|nr:TlpA disulfide reductase family protein [Oceanihabitans sediminis]MDX1277791.1 TlpA disulfide reductase family protein [Oceanihabitans sediminis]MDX1772743.1 TlpA disulfide reductase family protein [Oceanihabitans sediminis]RBP34414.1 peroxiredoxin [Oceanihabitans sediminis]RCU58088.1 TlpA family protein disulfide reductase [Oceanihabitans sediminis]